MQTHKLVQDSPEWHQFRLEHHGASEAAAMLGLSPKVKRTELLHIKHTGTPKEFSDWVRENILDYGHAVEALARPIVEDMIGEDLYAVTGSDGKLSVSCDGLTISREISWEHKQWSEKLAASVTAGVLPDEHSPQCQQNLMITKAKKLIFTVSDGTPEKMVHMEVFPDQEWFKRIKAGWEQFNKDLAEYQHVEILPAAVAEPVMALPSLSIRVNGSISLQSNLTIFGDKLRSFVDGIDKNPSDDQAFANAEAAVKVLEKAQAALEEAESSALAQTASIDEMRRTVAMHIELARTTRLMLEKIVKARKETIRVEIQQGAKDKATEHIASLNKRLGKPYMPTIATDFAGVMKGKKNIASLRDAVDTELARFKIEANAVADRIQFNLTTLRELASEHAFLFADTAHIVLKPNDDCTALIKLRIAEHKAAEEKRLEAERARIAEEERVKAEAKARAEQQERERREAAQRADEERKAQEERTRIAAAEAAVQREINQAKRKEEAAEPAKHQEEVPAAKASAPAEAKPAPSALRPAPASRPSIAETVSRDPMGWPFPIAHAEQREEPPKPSDAQIIAVLSLHFVASEETVLAWILEIAETCQAAAEST